MKTDELIKDIFSQVGFWGFEGLRLDAAQIANWPPGVMDLFVKNNLIRKISSAKAIECPGCEESCEMPVEVIPANHIKPARAFIVCDKKDDIGRVAIDLYRLEQWHISGASIAGLLASLLNLPRPTACAVDSPRWEVGVLRAEKCASHLVLLANGSLELSVAGHSIALSDVLVIRENSFYVDKRMLFQFVDNPLAGAGDTESADQRRERIRKRVQTLKAAGHKAFLKAVAKEEGVSISRLKQLLKI